MDKKAIVLTTVYEPSKAVIKFSQLKNFLLVVAGDKKTPLDWSLKGAIFLSLQNQFEKYPKLAKAIYINHYARKNLAYLEAIKYGVDYIYETDDDNISYESSLNFFYDQVLLKEVDAPPVFNIYSLFTQKKVWPRGIPLNLIGNKIKKIKKRKVAPYIQQSLSDIDPDVDAIYRLINGQMIKFDVNKYYGLASRTYCPLNSQNTYWHKKAFPLLYLPSTVGSRVTDIWRGYIAQRILWELGSRLIFISPNVFQKRNKHDLMNDFRQEMDLYLKTEDLLNHLNKINLKGDLKNMMLSVYQKLIAAGFFKKDELKIVNLWFEEISKLL